MTPVGYQQIAAGGLDTAQPLTLPTQPVQQPTYAIIVAVTQAIRWRDDGVAPTTTVGMPWPVNTPLYYDGDLKKFQVISATAGAELNVSYYYGARYA
jgi:hypothetical protein